MRDAAELSCVGTASVVAPAGHGKTQVIAELAGLGRRALILTHTHAGVHALKGRLSRLGVPRARVAVNTIAGWSMRYAHAFPNVAQPPAGLPQGSEWEQIYRGAILSLRIGAVRDVVAASYDRILIDEYQDCGRLQHELAISLSAIVPTIVFGDPMQGIFEFAGATLSWHDDIYPAFPLYGTLDTPYRWENKNPELGAWIAETRSKLLRGEDIDLQDPRITYRVTDGPFDMAALFEGIDGKEGSFAAIHCNKTLCYRLAKAANGGYQAIEEIGAGRLQQFAMAWDIAAGAIDRLRAIVSLIDDCIHKKQAIEGEDVGQDDRLVAEALRDLAPRLGAGDGSQAAVEFLALSRKRELWKLYRRELWRDAERAAAEVAAGRAKTMRDAADSIRQRVSSSGRKLPKRTVSTPLLLKGLEFDHVVIPDATHFSNERQAQAKLFYVAISRATRSLTVASSSRLLRFDRPAS